MISESPQNEAGKKEDRLFPSRPKIPPWIPVQLEKLIETAKDYARGAKSANTLRAYASDWRHFEA
jgi:hypothetical protein